MDLQLARLRDSAATCSLMRAFLLPASAHQQRERPGVEGAVGGVVHVVRLGPQLHLWRVCRGGQAEAGAAAIGLANTHAIRKGRATSAQKNSSSALSLPTHQPEQLLGPRGQPRQRPHQPVLGGGPGGRAAHVHRHAALHLQPEGSAKRTVQA